MTSVTISMNDELKGELKHFSWINWSELAREEALKKLIFQNYLQRGSITDEEWEFCESIDWHPVDELPLKVEFQNKMAQAKKEKTIKYKTADDFFNDLRL